jgi:hypothetical protein
MKKSKELQALHAELLLNMENIDLMIDKYIKKIKKEYSQILIDEKKKLLQKISEGEKIDINVLKSKYLKAKELSNYDNTKTVILTENMEDLLDTIEIDDETYYYENKEKGKVFNTDNEEIGFIKNNNVVFN